MQKTKLKLITYTGVHIDPLNIRPDDIRLLDIAHSLSNLCRYFGHVDYFYSVAQHSVLVAQQFEKRSYVRKWGLFHDAPETYLGDIVRSLKHSGHFDFYLEAEERAMRAICDKFDLEYEEPEEIDYVDKVIVRNAEMRDLKSYWEKDFEYTKLKIKPWLPQYAKAQFLKEAEALGVYA